jgi:DNA-binding MarR family transcriptional regulator
MPSTKPTPADTVLALLGARPGVTAAEIAEATGMARSTATKTLASLASEGRARRVAGGRDGGRRLPDRWSAPPAPARAKGASRAKTSADCARLGRGELAAQVLAYLRKHPGEHSPTAIAKALGGRSSGAVGNALDRLNETGDAVQTQPTPRRYTAS